MDFSKTAFIFPGQGSQEVGMGKELAAAYPIAQETFAEADEILGFSLSSLMFEGPEDTLNATAMTQPAVYVCGVAMLRVLQQELPQARPAFVAGHSLGEFTALTAANALSFEAGLKLVQQRGRLMQEAGDKNPGGMAAILGVDDETLERVTQEVSEQMGKPVVVANYNCPGQLVISGDAEALDAAVEAAKANGARRAIPLAVSVATHSPLMQPATEEFVQYVESTTFAVPTIPVYANVTATPMNSVEAIYAELEAQLTNGVRWTQSVQAMIDAGAEAFVEIGTKDVLTGLLRRINRSKIGIAVNTLPTLQSFVQTNG